MSPYASQQWTRRIRYGDQHIRVSDAERNAVAERLGQHYSEGRLDQAEFDERVGRTMAAKTRGDLAGLFDDLPDLEAEGARADSPAAPAGPVPGYRPRRCHGGGIIRPLLLVFALFVCANVAWHVFFGLFFIKPLIWAFVLAAGVIILSRLTRRDR